MLECSINGITIQVQPATDSRLASLHSVRGEPADIVTEHTTCNYGLATSLDHVASAAGMTVAAVDDLGEVRAVERPDHPFFLATLYQPQLRSTPAAPHPIFLGLVRAALQPA